MANNVGTPRFYVDDIQYSKAIGEYKLLRFKYNEDTINGADIYSDGNPSNPFKLSMESTDNLQIGFKHINYNRPYLDKNDRFYAVLGHNFASGKFLFRHHWENEASVTGEGTADNNGTANNAECIVNGTAESVIYNGGSNLNSPTLTTNLDGFSIVTYQGTNGNEQDFFGASRLQVYRVDGTLTTDTLHIGGIFMGGIYDMPHSPDLSLKLYYEYDGVKTIQTKGGATLSNTMYTKPADWGVLYPDTDYERTLGAWQLEDPGDGLVTSKNYRSGRRVWDLSFSYLSDTDVMPENGITDNGDYDTNILEGNNFFSQVWNKTMGGHLPFIFQPDGGDNSTNSPDGFAIARFDQSSLQYEQVAHNTYNVKLKIRECW